MRAYNILRNKEVMISEEWKKDSSDKNAIIYGFYLSLAETNPSYDSIHNLQDAYSESNKTDWKNTTTVSTANGFECYLDLTLFPSYKNNEIYKSWWLGYLDATVGEMKVLAYSDSIRDVIIPDSSNTFNLETTVLCQFTNVVTDSMSYISGLEEGWKSTKKLTDPFYKEDLEVLISGKSKTFSHGVSNLSKLGILFDN